LEQQTKNTIKKYTTNFYFIFIS